MADQAMINRYSVQIYNQARKGTPYNPGVPVAMANLLVAQAKHETGDFSHSFFTKGNNAFGYAYYSASNYQGPPGPLADNGEPIATFPTVEASVNEIVDWLYRRVRKGTFPDLATITTPAQYATLLKDNGYYGASLKEYITGLTNFFKQIDPSGTGSVAVVLAILAAAAYYYRKQIFPGSL